jgi:hypothetical protein
MPPTKRMDCGRCSPRCVDWKRGKDTCRANLRDLNKRVFGLDSETVPAYLRKKLEDETRTEMRKDLAQRATGKR